MSLLHLLFFSWLLWASLSQKNETEEPEKRVETECRERERLITTEKGDLYDIIDAVVSEKLILQCHYCNENDDGRPKNWYKIERPGVSSPHEVILDMSNDAEKNRVQVNKEHSLIIDNFNENDTGLYYCVGFEDQNSKDKFNFLVDTIFNDNATTIESGNITDWITYHDEQMQPINKLLSESQSPEFVKIRENLKVTLEVITQWDRWSNCEVCGRPKDEGVRKRKGLCRIKISSGEDTKKEDLTDDEKQFLQAPAISCKSRQLYRLFPELSNMTRVISDFVLREICSGTCNPDAEAANAGWKMGKTKGYKYRKSFVLQEKSHLTLVCPESTIDNEVTWRKNGKVLKPGDVTNPRLIVDTFGTLYLIEVSKEEAGNYTCQVDDIRMQQVRVFVYSKSRLLTGELGRYMIYLGFILFLCSFCYCGGLVITCYKRDTFKSYTVLKNEEEEKKLLLDELF